MSVRSVIIGVLALVFGGSAALGINMLRGKSPSGDTIPVVVAAGDIARFTNVTAEMLKTRDYPKELVPAGSFTNIDDVVDRVCNVALILDEPLLNDKLAPEGSGRGAAAIIPPGMRAFTIKTPSAEAGVAGFILPGNKVDVLLTLRGRGSDDPTGGGSTITLLEHVEILAVDQRVDAPSENKMNLEDLRSVTLLVTPDQANHLDLGQNMGTLHLSLRNPLDTTPARSKGATLAGLRFPQPSRPWDARLKDLLEAGAKLIPEARPREEKEVVAAPAPPPDPEPVEPPPPPKIRTLRGNLSGAVTVGG